MADTIVLCDHCRAEINLNKARIDTEIVSRGKREKRRVAVLYYFVCPVCKHKYHCFYKDREVNRLFAEDKQEEAQKRMEDLWEIFENGS